MSQHYTTLVSTAAGGSADRCAGMLGGVVELTDAPLEPDGPAAWMSGVPHHDIECLMFGKAHLTPSL